MVAEFGLGGLEPLVHLARIVRGADTARPELAPEAPGLLAASLGLSRMFRDDLAQLDAGMLLYDAMFRWCRDATGETHNWPAAQPGRRVRRERAAAAPAPRHRVRRRRVRGLGAGGGAELRRPGRADRGDAPHPGRREALGRRPALPAGAELLHAAAGARGAPAHDLSRLAACTACAAAWWPASLFVLPGFVAMMALSAIYVAYGADRPARRPLLRAQGGGARHRPAGGGAHRPAGARQPAAAGDRRGGLRRDLRLRRAVPADRPRRRPARLARRPLRRCSSTAAAVTAPPPAVLADADSLLGAETPAHARPGGRGAWRAAAGSRSLWLVPVAALVLALGPDQTFARLAVFFSQMAVVTFGGAYAVLAYVAQEAVQHRALAGAGRDARRARPGRDHARAADHGGAVRRLPRRLPQPRRGSTPGSPPCSARPSSPG